MPSESARPLVSVITPFLNVENYISEAVDSVLAQSYPQWELLLVDDGSKDQSTSIARRYAEKYPDRIFYFEHENHENRGASASRNLGFLKSKGELIAYLDADDIYLPNKLRDQVTILLKHPSAGMMYASTEYWYSWEKIATTGQKDWIWNAFGVPANKLYEPGFLLKLFLENSGAVPCMGSILARKEAIAAVGGWENSFKMICTDQVFHAKMTLHHHIYIAEGCWDKYRQHSKSSCQVIERQGKTQDARRTYLLWLERYLLDQNVSIDSPLWKSLQIALAPLRKTFINTVKLISKKTYTRLRKSFKRLSHK